MPLIQSSIPPLSAPTNRTFRVKTAGSGRVGFSGTPTELLPKGLGRCHFAQWDPAVHGEVTDEVEQILDKQDQRWWM